MKVAPPESPQHEIFFAPRNPLHPNHLPANPLRRLPKPAPPMPYPEIRERAAPPLTGIEGQTGQIWPVFSALFTIIPLFSIKQSEKAGQTCPGFGPRPPLNVLTRELRPQRLAHPRHRVRQIRPRIP